MRNIGACVQIALQMTPEQRVYVYDKVMSFLQRQQVNQQVGQAIFDLQTIFNIAARMSA
jgi:hypothetical protein